MIRSDPSIRWRLLHKTVAGKANLMVAGKANKIVGGRINKDGKANLMVDGKVNKIAAGRNNKNSNVNQMEGGKANRCSHSPGSDVPLNYRRDLREMADNREKNGFGINQ